MNIGSNIGKNTSYTPINTRSTRTTEAQLFKSTYLSNCRGQICYKERPNRTTNNGDVAETAECPVSE